MERGWGRVVALCACLGAVACGAADEPRVVVYVAADEDEARPILDAFEAQTGVRADARFDTESTKTSGLAAMLAAEADRPRCDVWWSGESVVTARLAREGLLATLPEAMRDQRAHSVQDSAGRWVGFAARVRALACALPEEGGDDPPADWIELANPRFRARIAMADPRFGTTRGHLGAIKAFLDRRGEGAYRDWAKGLAANEPRILVGGNSAAAEAVARGEVDYAATDSDDVLAAIARGGRIHPVALRHGPDAGQGAMEIPCSVGVVAGAPHAEAALRLAEAIASAATETALAKGRGAHLPLGPCGTAAAGIPMWIRDAGGDPLDISPEEAERAMDEAVAIFLEEVAARRGGG